jgi:hypothetical protein
MPITARLSRRFYDKFGDEIVNELVEWLNQVDAAFRAQLRQVSDDQFLRYEARLEQRLAEFGAELRREIAALRVEMHTELNSMKAELVKWMFLFWAGTTLAGLLFK